MPSDLAMGAPSKSDLAFLAAVLWTVLAVFSGAAVATRYRGSVADAAEPGATPGPPVVSARLRRSRSDAEQPTQLVHLAAPEPLPTPCAVAAPVSLRAVSGSTAANETASRVAAPRLTGPPLGGLRAGIPANSDAMISLMPSAPALPPNSSEGDAAARRQAIFDPPREPNGTYRIHTELERMLEVVGTVEPSSAASLRARLSKRPSRHILYLNLCAALERSAPKGSGDVTLCLHYYMEWFFFVKSLPPGDPRREGKDSTVLKAYEERTARTAGEHLLMHANGIQARIKEAVAVLGRGVPAACAPSDSDRCVKTCAQRLHGLRLSGAAEPELEAAFQDARRSLGPRIDWPDAGSPHLQLPGIRHRRFWDPAEISWLPQIEARWRDIRGELDEYIASRARSGDAAAFAAPQADHLASNWNLLELSMMGNWSEELCRDHFPVTCSLLRGQPALDPTNFRWPGALAKLAKPKGPGGEKPPVLMVNIFQSFPGSTLRAHFGTHGRIAASLGLHVPRGVALRVGSERREWREGKWLLFDDSYEHEVINQASEPRYVLVVHMLHPDVCVGCGGGGP